MLKLADIILPGVIAGKKRVKIFDPISFYIQETTADACAQPFMKAGSKIIGAQYRKAEYEMGKAVRSIHDYLYIFFMGRISDFFYRQYLSVPVNDMSKMNNFCF